MNRILVRVIYKLLFPVQTKLFYVAFKIIQLNVKFEHVAFLLIQFCSSFISMISEKLTNVWFFFVFFCDGGKGETQWNQKYFS